ncbi:MAG: peptide chain release factor 1 [Deltaproteobacteria bacterium]|nr:peptide chain release factor 1 [Deltaproteobacteria bacterium]
MLNQLPDIETRFLEIEKLLSNPDILSDKNQYRQIAKEHAGLYQIVEKYREYNKISKEIKDNEEILNDEDPEIRELARNEIEELTEKKIIITNDLKTLLIPKDPNDDKNIILEIRAGTGGEEAALFAADLFKMYSKYAENKNWKIEIANLHSTDTGGIKEVIAMIHGKGAYSKFKYESGTHRVQRVPTTEAQGRIHTSAVTVAVLPEAEDIEMNIEPNDIKVDVYRSTGPGGQSVNTTDSAVRLTHTPTGMVVTCQDEKSQHKNKAKAMKVLKARLFDMKISEENEKRSEERKSQVGTGDRSQRIRTYNFPQGRVTDHRIGLTLYKLSSILEGEIEAIIESISTFYQAEALK